MATAAVLMGVVAGIYVGFAVSDGRAAAIVIECVSAAAFSTCAIAGLLLSPWFILAALGGHAGWDFVHHRSGRWARTPRWYVPYCAVYDVTAAVGLGAMWFGRGWVGG